MNEFTALQWMGIDPAEAIAASELLGAWLLTYLLHSTFFLSAALLIQLGLRGQRDSLSELILRFALVGGILSASAALLLPDTLGFAAEPFNTKAAEPIVEDVGPILFEPVHPVAAGIGLGAAGIPNSASSGTPLGALRRPQGIGLVIMLAAFALGLGLTVRSIWRGHIRLRRALKNRMELSPSSRPRLLLNELLEVAGVAGARWSRRIRLSASDELAVPIAMGIRRPEICLPGGRIEKLDDAQLRLVLAHELGHLIRRDPLYQLAARIIEGALFFQPLNALARRGLRAIAEFQCDAWAGEVTGEPTKLARVLTDVAEWLVSDQRSADRELLAPAAAMAERRSSIRRRIERLLATRAAARATRRGRAVAILACAGSLASVAVASPRFAPAASGGDSASSGTATMREFPANDIASVLADFDTEIAVLRGEAALLGARARTLNADEETLALFQQVEARLQWLDQFRRDVRTALEDATSKSASESSPVEPSESASAERRLP